MLRTVTQLSKWLVILLNVVCNFSCSYFNCLFVFDVCIFLLMCCNLFFNIFRLLCFHSFNSHADSSIIHLVLSTVTLLLKCRYIVIILPVTLLLRLSIWLQATSSDFQCTFIRHNIFPLSLCCLSVMRLRYCAFLFDVTQYQSLFSCHYCIPQSWCKY